MIRRSVSYKMVSFKYFLGARPLWGRIQVRNCGSNNEVLNLGHHYFIYHYNIFQNNDKRLYICFDKSPLILYLGTLFIKV